MLQNRQLQVDKVNQFTIQEQLKMTIASQKLITLIKYKDIFLIVL